MGQIFVGTFLTILGGIHALRPDLAMKYRFKIAEKLYGMQIKATKRTENIYRILGVFFILCGLSVLVYG